MPRVLRCVYDWSRTPSPGPVHVTSHRLACPYRSRPNCKSLSDSFRYDTGQRPRRCWLHSTADPELPGNGLLPARIGFNQRWRKDPIHRCMPNGNAASRVRCVVLSKARIPREPLVGAADGRYPSGCRGYSQPMGWSDRSVEALQQRNTIVSSLLRLPFQQPR